MSGFEEYAKKIEEVTIEELRNYLLKHLKKLLMLLKYYSSFSFLLKILCPQS